MDSLPWRGWDEALQEVAEAGWGQWARPVAAAAFLGLELVLVGALPLAAVQE